MKLLIIVAIKEFEKDIKQILKKSDVKSFSYKDVTGYKDGSEDSIEKNWFASEMKENESVLFYAFVDNEKVDSLFELVDGFNAKQETVSHIHVAVLSVEKSN
jgi:nitrogen regulatory protein PII